MFKTDQVDAVNWLVQKFHYSHRPIPSRNIVLAVSFHPKSAMGFDGTDGPAHAGCLFTLPSARMWQGKCIELLRLVRRDDYQGPPLTQLISFGIRKLKEKKAADLLVSFADSSFGHHGGIYQACSWFYGGQRKRSLDGFQVGKVFMPRRTCFSTFGTSSLPGLLEKFKGRSVRIKPHYDTGKYLYWKPLNKEGKRTAEQLGLESLLYLKPKESNP